VSAALALEKLEALADIVPTAGERPLDPIGQVLVEKMASGFDRLREEAIPAPPLKPGKPDRRPFFLPDAFTNPDHVHYALKTTAAAMLCYLAYTLTDWPGIHTCFITCYIVSLGTAGESVEKLRLRLLGCLFGAALGIAVMLTIMPWIDAIESLLLVVWLGTFLAAWVAGGSPRIAYAGFQIAFAFYLCVIQGTAPEFDMAVARDRVIGVLLGNVVAFAMITEIWPVSMGRQLDLQLHQLIQGLKGLVNRSLESPWCETGPRLHAQACQLRERLGLASLEPVAIRPTDQALATRADMVALASRLNDALLVETLPESLALSEGLERLHQALRISIRASDPRVPPADARAAPEAPGEIQSAMIELDALATQISAIHGHPRHA
jgi:multidrug resistance protein MdtO